MEGLKGMHKMGSGPSNAAGAGDRKAFRLLLGPFVGLLYVILMPFLAIVTVAVLMGRKVAGVLFGMAGRSVSFGWRPEASYLSGKEKEKEKNNGAK